VGFDAVSDPLNTTFREGVLGELLESFGLVAATEDPYCSARAVCFDPPTGKDKDDRYRNTRASGQPDTQI